MPRASEGAGALVIGCGNRERGDDAAGLAVAAGLRALGIDTIEHSGDGAALLDLWQMASDVILVDAVRAAGEAGAIQVWGVDNVPLDRQFFASSTHHFGVAEAIRLARALHRLPETLRIFGITAGTVSPGAGMTPEVAAAVQEVIHRVAAEFRAARSVPALRFTGLEPRPER